MHLQLSNLPFPGNYEFHISRRARDRYAFDATIFQLNGNVLFADFRAAREFTQRMNLERDVVADPQLAVRAGDINALGLIDEILHYVAGLYKQQENIKVFEEGLSYLYARLGPEMVDAALMSFTGQFPAVAVYQGELSPSEYLEGQSGGVPNRLIVLEEMLLLWLANANPAFEPFSELFDDKDLRMHSVYAQMIDGLQDFFDEQPPFGPEHQNLVSMLRTPAVMVPNSLSGQLEYIRAHWADLLGDYLLRLLTSLDLIAEESRLPFTGFGPPDVYDFSAWGMSIDEEPERFSPDKDWMPSLVLMAKNAYVWLDQLSKTYGREIKQLDQIPDEELDKLADWGFNGLWLIGLWERSTASKKIKQMRGNEDAIASAYSLYDYTIAHDLGGEEAVNNLRERAWQRGMRLASDMVPNHMGIDSRWVLEHPDWFLSLPQSPYPSYSFNGVDLTDNDNVGIYLEDHYYDDSDAAVVFKRVDALGEARYIYHGNDGTGLPWNDTAQLDFLKAEVREGVIQTILHVARQFPVIRFDAAMTLAKKHIQRLWFPKPGEGGAVPSRAEHAMSQAAFDAAIPEEFWREVVDRIAQEVPDTLLLAEAFWMMEGYFVRTLGMHRVYNSAFMHMLRDEDNAKYRAVMKNTLEFNPQILKRFVNFMNNPDEDTAEAQFGKGDKYFGVAVMMATLPGLPMFGHGQIEGFTEKYGMEYQRAYYDEQPDEGLVNHHQRVIFPLLRRRRLFAEVDDFLLYDFFSPHSLVNEDVFAYSNRLGDQRALVVYHNKFGEAQGWMRTSAAYAQTDGEESALVQRKLGEGLGLDGGHNVFWVFRDYVSGLQYIRNARDLSEGGLYLELGAYQAQVFLDFDKVYDSPETPYAQLNAELDGKGVPNIYQALRELELRPVLQPFRELVNAGMMNYLIDNRAQKPRARLPKALLDETRQKTGNLLQATKAFSNGAGDPTKLEKKILTDLKAVLALPVLYEKYPLPRSRKYKIVVNMLLEGLDENKGAWATLLSWVLVSKLGAVADPENALQTSRAWLDEWLLDRQIAAMLQETGVDEGAAWQRVALLRAIIGQRHWYRDDGSLRRKAYRIMRRLLEDVEVRQYLNINEHESVVWFNKEAMEDLLWWLLAIGVGDITANPKIKKADKPERIVAVYDIIKKVLQSLEASAYQVEKLLEELA
ncbi:MAG: alpha-amylase [Chloroflexi bacterium]|nr:MAG: alpha-amylase [Chloroflexota bacterium]MBL1196844.1 alpha-amylase [Chloroflexota bacterium]NOH14139.1 alpha-amylase [Chloroflexota bacterium]